MRALVGEGVALVAVGGVGSPADVRAMFDAGADLVQLYSALIYKGPALVRTLALESV